MLIGARVEESLGGDKIEPEAAGMPDRKAATGKTRSKLLSLPGRIRF